MKRCVAALVGCGLVGLAISMIWAQSGSPLCDEKLFTVSCQDVEGTACFPLNGSSGLECLGDCTDQEQCSAAGVMVDICFTGNSLQTNDKLNCRYVDQPCGVVQRGVSECMFYEVEEEVYVCSCELSLTTEPCSRYHFDGADPCIPNGVARFLPRGDWRSLERELASAD